MNARNRTCAECGAPLAEDAPHGLCPQCLLKAGMESSAPVVSVSEQTPTLIAPPPHSTFDTQTLPATVHISPSAVGACSQPNPIANQKSKIENSFVHYFGDYELLEEIARGGMGVVYKARQISLNRIVAVKMILAGQFATEAEVKRFHVEAEAAANLQHPNIVAIHEVGVHEGQHYFSMDYVDGQSLAAMISNPKFQISNYAATAALLKTIAEAVHYAHQRGTLHRDLKPQNILMDEQGRPRITDFGLAKRLQDDSGLTHSGAVMGSPSYMAPEQAAGRQAEIGPQSDVYSLGAILYELLTARPPFKRETPTATLVQVLEEEPVRPRRLVPGVPADLETICLKCLEKRPERRYASARALAEELERFLTHVPILARPASHTRRAWSWLQKHPWAVAGSAALLVVGLACTAFGIWQRGRYQLWQTAHPGEVFRLGFQPLLVTSWLGLFLLLLACLRTNRKLGYHLRRHREEGGAIPGSVIGANLAVGSAVVAYSLLLLFKQVEVMAWQAAPWAGFTMLLPWTLAMVWTGAGLAWAGLGASELSDYTDLVSRHLAAADARDERYRQIFHVYRRGFREYLLPLAIVVALFVLLSGVFGYVAIHYLVAAKTARPSLKVAIWLGGLAAWVMPAWLFTPRRGEPIRGWDLGRKFAAAALVLAAAWGVDVLAIGPPLALAVVLGCASLGLLSAVEICWRRKHRTNEKRLLERRAEEKRHLPSVFHPKRPFMDRLMEFGVSGPIGPIPPGVVFAFVVILFAWGTVQTWRSAAADYGLLQELTAAGKLLSRQSYLEPRVPDAANFAQCAVLQAIGYQATLDTNRWSRYLAFETVANREGWFSLAPGGGGVSTAGRTNATGDSRNDRATRMLQAAAPLEAEFEELRQATIRPFAQMEPEPLETAAEKYHPPHWPAYQLLPRLLLVHADAELALGRSGEAWRDLRVVQRLAEALGGNRRLACTLLRVGLVQLCQQGFWEGWRGERWSEGELQQWDHWFGSVDLLRDFALSLRGEEPYFVNRVYDAQAAAHQSRPISMWGGFREQYLYNQLLSGCCDAAFDAHRQVVYPVRGQAFQAQADQLLKAQFTDLPPALRDFPYPLQDGALPRLAYVQTLVNMSRIAAVLSRYRAQAGGLPATLVEVAPRYLSRVPHDLIGGKPLVYRRTAEGRFILYSVGWNEQDDGGKAPSNPGNLTQGDWVWPNEPGEEKL